MNGEIWVAEVADPKYPRIVNIDKPRLLIGRIVSEYQNAAPEKYVSLLNSGLKNTKSTVTNNASIFAQKHSLEARTDLVIEFGQKVIQKYPDRIRDAKEFLEEKGYVVDTFGAERLHTIYVVDLDSSANKAMAPWVYVGQTTLTPEERLQKHLDGGPIASPKVANYGLRLNLNLYKDVPQTHFLSDALALEVKTKTDLEADGYTVAGGH